MREWRARVHESVFPLRSAASTTAFSRSFSINGVFRLNGIVGVPLARSIAQGANQTRLRCAPKKTLLPSFPSSAPLMSFSSFLRGVR